MKRKSPVELAAAVASAAPEEEQQRQLQQQALTLVAPKPGQTYWGLSISEMDQKIDRKLPVELAAAVAQLAREGDDLADDELRHAARVAEGRVEHRDPHRIRRLQRRPGLRSVKLSRGFTAVYNPLLA